MKQKQNNYCSHFVLFVKEIKHRNKLDKAVIVWGSNNAGFWGIFDFYTAIEMIINRKQV